MAEYRLTPAAERDLESIWTYTVRQWGVEQADRYIDFLTAAFVELANAPKTAPSCDHVRSGYRRWGVERHMIYFRVTDLPRFFGPFILGERPPNLLLT